MIPPPAPSLLKRLTDPTRLTSGLLVLALVAVAAFMLARLDASREIGGFLSQGEIVGGLLLANLALALLGYRRYRRAVVKVAEAAQAERQARILTSNDPLTGFLNRSALAEAAAQELIRAGRARQAMAMLVVDLDGFKTVNDLHGHLTGDNLLRVAAEVIRGALPPGAVLGRIGADEFAAAFAFDTQNVGAVDAAARTIVERLGKPFDLAGVHTHVSASLGAARTDSDCSTVEALMRRADIAMFTAKKLGRGRCAWFDESMQLELIKRNEIEAGLRAGIPAGEVVPYFEQQVDLVTGQLHGFEMLARWHRPNRGVVQPNDFIPIAEESGLIGDLSLSVMRQAMAEARGWDSALMLSVNISPIQLKDPWLAQKIAKLLSETGFPAERLEVEITESSLFENLGLAQAIVASLKNQGIRLALDDFGTGYSSLAHLRALPFDRIKIDRSFVTSINDNPESAAIVTAITRLADSLNLAITAEGIEDQHVEARLRSIGTYCGQGWWFGKPMPVEGVRTLLASRGLLPATRDYRMPSQRGTKRKSANA